MFCPNCGNNCGDAKFCSECGRDLRINATVPEIAKEYQIGTVMVDTEDVSAPESIFGVYGSGNCYMHLEEKKAVFENKKLGTMVTVCYGNIAKTTIFRASPAKHGFLCCRDWENRFCPDPSFDNIDADKTSISFSILENVKIYQAYLFLKQCADNRNAKEPVSAAQQMIDDAMAAREYERQKGYIPGQTIASSPETFNVDKLAWYPGKKKDDRKAKIVELEHSGQVYCPKCLSTSISANQKGFGFARGAIGAAVGLDVGLIVGGIGSKKVICTCLKCGYQWKAGKK